MKLELEQQQPPYKRMPLLTMCVCVCVYLSVCACVYSYLCVCLRKIFNLNDISGNGRGGAATGACKLSQHRQQHRQPGWGNGNGTGKSLIVDIIFLTALHLFLGSNLSTLLAVCRCRCRCHCLLLLLLPRLMLFPLPNRFPFYCQIMCFFFLSSSIDCIMLFIDPVRERKGCLPCAAVSHKVWIACQNVLLANHFLCNLIIRCTINWP